MHARTSRSSRGRADFPWGDFEGLWPFFCWTEMLRNLPRSRIRSFLSPSPGLPRSNFRRHVQNASHRSAAFAVIESNHGELTTLARTPSVQGLRVLGHLTSNHAHPTLVTLPTTWFSLSHGRCRREVERVQERNREDILTGTSCTNPFIRGWASSSDPHLFDRCTPPLLRAWFHTDVMSRNHLDPCRKHWRRKPSRATASKR